jgi:hypothetical protein
MKNFFNLSTKRKRQQDRTLKLRKITGNTACGLEMYVWL